MSVVDKIKSLWSTILSIAVAILGAFLLFERSKRKSAEAENLSGELREKDATLKEKQRQQEENAARHREELNALPKPDAPDLSPEDVEKHWNKK